MSSKTDESCGRGVFAGLSAILFATRCSTALRARPPAIEIFLRLGREIHVPGERAQVIECVRKLDDIPVFGVDIEQIGLVRSGGAIANRLAYDDGVIAVLQRIDG